MKVKPMGMLLMMLAGWINRHQQDVITYLKEENKILREKLGTKRTLLRDGTYPDPEHWRKAQDAAAREAAVAVRRLHNLASQREAAALRVSLVQDVWKSSPRLWYY